MYLNKNKTSDKTEGQAEIKMNKSIEETLIVKS